MSDSSSTSASCSTSSDESEDEFRHMSVTAAEPSNDSDIKDDSTMPQPDHTKLGADLSLMSFLKQGPTRRGVVNAVNPMMPISTSEIFNPMQGKIAFTYSEYSNQLSVKTKRIGEPPKVESVKAPPAQNQNKVDELKKEVKRSSLGLPSNDLPGRRLSVTGVAPPGGRRSSIRRRSSIYLNPGQVNQDVMPEKSILRRDSVMNNQPLTIPSRDNVSTISNTTSLLSGLNPNLPGLGPGLGRDRSRSILMMSSKFDEDETDEASPVKVVKPEMKRIGIRVKRDSEDNDGVVGFGNVNVAEIQEKEESEEIDEEAAMMRARMSRRRSTVFAEQLTEELGFPEVKINKDDASGRDSKKRQSRFKTAENKLAMAASERRRSMAERRVSQVSRRQSMIAGRRRSSVRASSIYDEDDVEKLPSHFCTFEVTRHAVDKLLMRCREQMESNPQSATDIVELIALVSKLSEAAFAARDDYEEECIKFHLAQKRIVDYPLKFQAEIDLMALGIRHANKAFLGKLKEEREVMVDKGAKCESDCEKLFDTNRLLAKEKDISEKLMAALVDGLNQRMSAKAKTQIKIFKALNQIATATEKIDALPTRLEILTSNTDEDIKQFEFEIAEQISQIEKNSNASIKEGNQLNELYAEYSQLNQVRKDHARSIEQGNKTKWARMRRIEAEMEFNEKLLSEKTQVRDFGAASLEMETTAAQDSYLNYDNQIADLEGANAKLIELIEPIEKEHLIEKKQRIENVAMEHQLKMKKDKNEEAKKIVSEARNELLTKLDVVRLQMDDVLDNQSLLHVQEDNSKQAALATQKVLEVTLEKEKNMLKVAKKARLKVYQEWSAIEKRLNAKKTQLSKYKFKTNLMVAKLKNEISTTTDNSIGPRDFIKSQRTKIFDTIVHYKKQKKHFEGQENGKRFNIKQAKKRLSEYCNKIDELKETLSVREPIYREVIAETNKNDTIHHRIKTKLTVRQAKLKSLTKEKEKLIANTNALVKTFKEYQRERSATMDATRQLIDESRKVITELDGQKYSLLVEKEQFMFSNATIRKAKEHHGTDIDNMTQCDAEIDTQIVKYGERLNDSSGEICQARAKYDAVFEHHSSTGASNIDQLANFKANVIARDQVVTKAVDKLTEFTASFDSYDHDISQLKKDIVQNEKMRERQAKPILEQKVAGRETFRMNNIKQKRPDRINKRLDMSQAALFALHKKDLLRLRRSSQNKLVN